MDHVRAIRFLLHALRSRHPASGDTVVLPMDGPDPDVEVLRYRPARPWGAVLALHGMTRMGAHDPRMVALGWALCRVGLEVWVPDIDDVRALRLLPTSAARVGRIIAACHQHLGPHYPGVGLFGASFCAGLGLRAVSDPTVGRHVLGVLALGTYADPGACLARCLESETMDPYARLIVLRNYLEQLAGASEGVLQALDVAIDDNWHARSPGAFPTVLAALPRGQRQALNAYLFDLPTRRRLARQLLDHASGWVDPLGVLDVADRIAPPVVLVHGVDDDVIPAEESSRLHARLRGEGRDSHLLLTRLLSHGDARLGSAIVELPLAIGAFARWFRLMRRPAVA